MEIIASYYTDAGNIKQINQDSLSVQVVNSPKGKIAFAVVCDGMGGLEQGELASKETVIAFNEWFRSSFVKMVAGNVVSEERIFEEWTRQIESIHHKLGEYAFAKGIMLGTTLTVLLIYQNRYYVCHIGDSRIYLLGQAVQMLTVDHTLVAQEVRMGRLTKEQANVDPRRSILLQCLGACEIIEPQMDSGFIQENVTFILCSDGFVHKVKEVEMNQNFRPELFDNKEQLADVCEKMVKLAMERGERDNITVIGIVAKM